MNIGKRIKERRLELGLSVDDIAEVLNKDRSTLYRYESNDIEKLPTTILEPLAKILKTTPAYLMGWDDNSSKPQNIFSLDNIIPIETYKLPLLGTIACGKPILAEENIESYIDADMSVHADFALRCKGDSMINARIFDGDIVYIRSQPDVENGEIAAVLIDNVATLKRVYKYPSHLELRSENSTFEVLNFEGDSLKNVKILGKAVAFLSAGEKKSSVEPLQGIDLSLHEEIKELTNDEKEKLLSFAKFTKAQRNPDNERNYDIAAFKSHKHINIEDEE